MSKSKFLCFVCAFFALFAFTGCAYRLGTTLPQHIKTVALRSLVNRSGEPRIEIDATRAIRQEFQREGQLTLTDSDAADLLVDVDLISYDLSALRYEQNRPRKTQEYKMTIKARVTATERRTGKVYLTTTVTGDTRMSGRGDSLTAKRTAIPEVMKDLAEELVDAVVGAW